jgi:hypothetical protein
LNSVEVGYVVLDLHRRKFDCSTLAEGYIREKIDASAFNPTFWDVDFPSTKLNELLNVKVGCFIWGEEIKGLLYLWG